MRTGCSYRAIVGAQHIDLIVARVIAPDRLLRNRERVCIDALLDLDADIHARQKLMLWIREFSAQSDLTRGLDPRSRPRKAIWPE